MMITSPVTAAQTTAPASNGFTLTPGQVINALVVKNAGGSVGLQLGNMFLPVQTEMELQPGQRLELRVMKADPQLIELKLLTDKPAENPGLTILARLGLRPEPQGEVIARQLMKFDLPVSPATIGEIFRLLKGKGLPGEFSALVVWLKSLGLEIESAEDLRGLESVKKFLAGKSPEGEAEAVSRMINASPNPFYGHSQILAWTLGNAYVFLLQDGPNRDAVQPEGCTLLIKLDSKVLGELWFQLENRESEMAVTVTCKEPQTAAILGKELPDLRQQLQECGYQVGKMRVDRAARPPSILDLVPAPPEGPGAVDLEV